MAINIEYKSFYNYIQLTIFTQIPVEPHLLFLKADCLIPLNMSKICTTLGGIRND